MPVKVKSLAQPWMQILVQPRVCASYLQSATATRSAINQSNPIRLFDCAPHAAACDVSRMSISNQQSAISSRHRLTSHRLPAVCHYESIIRSDQTRRVGTGAGILLFGILQHGSVLYTQRPPDSHRILGMPSCLPSAHIPAHTVK